VNAGRCDRITSRCIVNLLQKSFFSFSSSAPLRLCVKKLTPQLRNANLLHKTALLFHPQSLDTPCIYGVHLMKTTHWLSCWQLGLIGLLTSAGINAFTCRTLAQTTPSNIKPDATLGAESSQILQNQSFRGLRIEEIRGGATRGINLFHSFLEFNVSEGRGAYFLSPSADIQNIFARVTGANRSEILGRLGTSGNSQANLYLINPNGIIFGKNASLDVQGSFVGTTANGVQFGNLGNFSATNPQEVPLLTINPSALFVNQINKSAAIQNNSVARTGTDPAGFNAYGLRVPDGKSLLLVGDNVTMDGGQLNAYGGRVELGGLAAAGSVNLLVNGDRLSLKFPENVTRADVSLTNQAGVYVTDAGGGDIAINARNINILGGSELFAGIAGGFGTPKTVAGDITLNGTGDINVSRSGIVNVVEPGAIGNGGNITIDSGSFSLRDGAVLIASTLGQGNAGNVTVIAKDAVSLANARIFSTVEREGVGKGGNIDINAATLSLTDRAQLLTLTRPASATQPAGKGDAGNVNVKVTGAVDIAGVKNGIFSGISSEVGTGAVGNGGNITIDSGSFSLRDGAQLSASTYGQGNAGNVTVIAKDAVSLAGGQTTIFSTVEAGGVGKGGNIDINAATLSLTDGAQLLTSTLGASATQPAGRGDAGNVNVKVTGAVDIAGVKNVFESGISSFESGIRSRVNTGTVGNAGNITIDSGSFSLRDGAVLIASTSGQGNAGNIRINALDAVTVSGTNQETGTSGGLFTFTNSTSAGKGGDITVNTNIFRISDGALLDARTYNNQKGGNITVNANVFEALNGGKLITTTESNGRAGKITVNATDKVIISGSDPNYNNRIATFPSRLGNIGANSGLFVSSTGSGITGDIEINSPKVTLDNQGKLNADSASGNGGNINLNVSDLLLLRHNSQISTTAGTAKAGGNGGNININSRFIVAIPNENSDISANAFTGAGGNIQINSQGIFGIEARPKPTEKSDITASSELGVSGVININAADTSSIQNSFAGAFPNAIDTNALIADSCIVRGDKRQENSFFITGSGAITPDRPGVMVSQYSTGEVRGVVATSRPWKKGDPIIEPTGVYRLSNGQILLSRECSN
jgi:filamentous hemagglutinin family protein